MGILSQQWARPRLELRTEAHLAVADLERIVIQGLQYSYFAIPCNATVRAELFRFLLHALCKQPLISGASWDRGSGTRASRTGRIETRQGARYVYIHIYIYMRVCVCVRRIIFYNDLLN